jgi:transcriptional regulator with XRE-family HTH domain
MTQDDGATAGTEATARRRLRSLRQARGWTIDDLSERAHLSASTISRIETGDRRITLDHLTALTSALGVAVGDVLEDDESPDDVVIRPVRDTAHGHTFWMLTRHDDPSGRVVAKMRVPAEGRRRQKDSGVHPGREWFYVLDGTVRLDLGDHSHLVRAGQAAEFDTMRPHRMVGEGGPAEVLSIFDRHGEDAHLREG